MTTEAVTEDVSPLYTHPSLRATKHEQFIARLEQIRARRLVAALEFRTASLARIQKEHEKLNTKWEALASKIDKKLYAIMEAIETAEADTNKLVALNNQMAILE